MPSTIRPIVVTRDLERLLAFYTGLLGAREIMRFPEEGRSSTSASHSAIRSSGCRRTPAPPPGIRAGCC